MTAFANIGAAEANAEMATARAIGTTVALYHRGGTAVTLTCHVLGNRTEQIMEGGVVREARVLEIEIPIQTHFAVTADDTEPIVFGDKIIYGGRNHFVLDPIGKSPSGHVYTVKCAESKRLASGARG